MAHLMEVTCADIERLSDYHLTDLLRRLLHLEVASGNLPLSSISVPLKIDVPDGGEDGRVQWAGGPNRTTWIPYRLTLFQCKARDMGPKDCKSELFCRGGNTLKPRIEEVLDAGGAYVLFYGRACNRTLRRKRIAGIRQGLREAGKAYADTAAIEIYDADRIAEWANLYVAARLQVCRGTGRSLPLGICTWRAWEPEWSNDPLYESDETLRAHMSQLKAWLVNPRAVARVLGLSGLGKSRLAFETFRPPGSPDVSHLEETLSDEVVYLRSDEAVPPQQLAAYVREWITCGLSAILVVDNCGPSIHESLAREVRRADSRFSLLTLDYDSTKPQGCPYIELRPASDEVVVRILRQNYPSLTESDVSHVAFFAQGFPQMAVLLAKARLNDEATIGRLNDDELLNRLLWARGPRDEVGRRVVSILSLFEYVGFERQRSKDRIFLASHFGLNSNDFYRITANFIKRGIVEKKGDFVRVTPAPLAIRLASDWWTETPPEAIEELLSALPGEMLQPLCDQVRRLDFLPEAEKFVAKVCGPQGPLGRPDVLKSETGSRIICSLVEVNPKATVEALHRVFGVMSRADLLRVEAGRRNLIWSLEKLCFWPETFPVAARLMLAFAAAENETWANNATAQFLQLYHLRLSGTQACPDDRLAVIDEALRAESPECRILGIRALGAALEALHFSRNGGVESQGSRPPSRDWEPKTRHDTFDYWREALSRLTIAATSGDAEQSNMAREEIAKSIRGLVRAGFIRELGAAISEIVRTQGGFWPSALEQLQLTLHYDGPHVPDEIRDWLHQHMAALQPTSIPDRLRLIVSRPPFGDVERLETGELVDRALKKAEALAEELAGFGPPWFQHLRIVFEGEQRQGYGFGRRLAQVTRDPRGFLGEALRVLGSIPVGRASPAVLAGFLSALRSDTPELAGGVLDRVAADPGLALHLVDLSRLSDPQVNDLQRIMRCVADGKIPVEQLASLGNGRVLDALPADAVIGFCDDMLTYGVPGAATALGILRMYCWNAAERQAQCRGENEKIVTVQGLASHPSLDMYAWYETVLSLLQDGDTDLHLETHLAQEVVRLCDEENATYRMDHVLAPVLRVLLSKRGQEVWPLFSRALLSENARVSLHLQHLLGHPSPDREKPVISSVPPDILLNWCEEERGASALLARIIPLLNVDESDDDDQSDRPRGEIGWTSLALSLISRFGTKPEVLQSIRRNLLTRTFSGSLVPYLQRDIEALQQLSGQMTEVRAWVNSTIDGLRREIEDEKRHDEEWELGLY